MQSLVLSAVLGGSVVWWYGIKNWVREGIDFHPFNDTSYPNALKQHKGNRWSKNSYLKEQFSESDLRDFKLDNFDYSRNYLRHVSIYKKLLFNKKSEIYIEPLSLTQGLMIISPMGGGKTVSMESYLAQPWYNRVLINDEKSGDFVSKWYNTRKDIILCPFDKRAHVWNVLGEELEVIEFYINNAIEAASGGNKSFFTNDAKERYLHIARLTIEIEEPIEKWKFFIKELELMFKEVEEGDSRSENDVISTMKQVMTQLKLNLYQLEQGKKSFIISDFFEKKHQAKLFMLNVDKYESSLNPLFSAFTACLAMIHASKEESKEDLTFYLLDEYLSLKMTYEAKKLLHTKIRSKGGCLLCAMHYFPDEQKLFDLLTSSTYAYMIFSVKNERTRKFFNEQVGKREYTVIKTVAKKVQESIKQEEILDWSELDKLGKANQHVTYIPSEGALFLAKSDYIQKPLINEAFILDEGINHFYLTLNDEYLKKRKKKSLNDSAVEKYEKAS
ncbi:MAG: type IV secretion system DNA-binding domain-containing protein [Sulfurimonas sp.]|nr:type IV secretion system DNA-binding domain-containing protein [Sulfurimonas sp.]